MGLLLEEPPPQCFWWSTLTPRPSPYPLPGEFQSKIYPMFEQLGALQMALRDEHRLMVVHYRLLEALDGMQGQYKPIATKSVRQALAPVSVSQSI